MTTMADRVFIDTNIFLNAAFAQREKHQECQQEIEAQVSQDAELWISGQVIREFLRVATKMESEGKELSFGEIRYRLNRYLTLCLIADETPEVRETLLRLWSELEIRGKHIHDANIVATMQAAGIPTLLSLDKGFRRYTKHIELRVPNAQSSA